MNKRPRYVEATVNVNANGNNAAVWVRVIGYSKLFREGSRYRPMIRAHEPIDVISQTLPTPTLAILLINGRISTCYSFLSSC